MVRRKYEVFKQTHQIREINFHHVRTTININQPLPTPEARRGFLGNMRLSANQKVGHILNGRRVQNSQNSHINVFLLCIGTT